MEWAKPRQSGLLTQVSGDTVMSLSNDYFHITVVPSEGSSGLVKFDVRPRHATFVPVQDNGADLEVDLAGTNLNFIIDGMRLSELKVKPQSVVGSFRVIVNMASK